MSFLSLVTSFLLVSAIAGVRRHCRGFAGRPVRPPPQILRYVTVPACLCVSRPPGRRRTSSQRRCAERVLSQPAERRAPCVGGPDARRRRRRPDDAALKPDPYRAADGVPVSAAVCVWPRL